MGETTVTLIIFLHKYPAVYGKWTTQTEGNINDLSVIKGLVRKKVYFICLLNPRFQ